MRAVHPVFHVSMLEPSSPSSIPNRVPSPPPPIKVEGELEYEISEVLDVTQKPGNALALVLEFC